MQRRVHPRPASGLLAAVLCLAFAGQEGALAQKQPPEAVPLETRRITLPLPVFISTKDIETVAHKRLFTRDGRFYVCDKIPDCKDRWKQLYFENLHVGTAGDSFVMSLHLGGRVPTLLYHRNVSADIKLTGTLSNEGAVVKIPNLSMDIESSNLLLKIADRGFNEKITAKLQEALEIDTQPVVQKALEKLETKFPVGWGSSCLLFDTPTTELERLYVKPGGIVAEFNVGLRVSADVECPERPPKEVCPPCPPK